MTAPGLPAAEFDGFVRGEAAKIPIADPVALANPDAARALYRA
jgi:hypothetical protein